MNGCYFTDIYLIYKFERERERINVGFSSLGCWRRWTERQIHKDNIAAVTYCRGNDYKELRAVCVGPGISHADRVGTVMSQVWVEFILKFSTPY